MTAAKVIDEIKNLSPRDQAEVIQFTFELARRRQLSPDDLGVLAEKLANSTDPAEIIRLRAVMTHGFYGE